MRIASDASLRTPSPQRLRFSAVARDRGGVATRSLGMDVVQCGPRSSASRSAQPAAAELSGFPSRSTVMWCVMRTDSLPAARCHCLQTRPGFCGPRVVERVPWWHRAGSDVPRSALGEPKDEGGVLRSVLTIGPRLSRAR
jgi:hypothetical protein